MFITPINKVTLSNKSAHRACVFLRGAHYGVTVERVHVVVVESLRAARNRHLRYDARRDIGECEPATSAMDPRVQRGATRPEPDGAC